MFLMDWMLYQHAGRLVLVRQLITHGARSLAVWDVLSYLR